MTSSDYIAMLALAVSLISTWISLYWNSRYVRVTSYKSATELFLELDRSLLQYPEIRPYFYEGAQMTTDDQNRNRVLTMAELFLDVFEWIGLREYGLSEDDWREYTSAVFRNSPALREYHQAHPEWHPKVEKLLLAGPGI